MLLAQQGIDPRPVGFRTPQSWPLHYRANCWTATLFSFYLIGFFHSETNVKELAAQPGIDPRPLGCENHSTTTTSRTVTFLLYLILFFHSWANLSYGYLKSWGAQARNSSRSLGFEHHMQPWPLHHHDNGWTPFVFLLYLIFFSLWNRLKKISCLSGNRA